MPTIRILDMEGTGLQPDAKVVEVAHIDFDPMTRAIGNAASWLCRVDAMPPDTRAVHHIRAEETWGQPPYDRRCLYEQAVRDGIDAWAAYNSAYEERFLIGSIPMLCVYKAALRVWPDAPSHSCFGVLYYLEDQGLVSYDRQLAHPPHRALPDAYATAVILSAIYDRGFKGADLMQWTREPAMIPRCPIGDWRGHRWGEIDDGFLNWIVSKIYDREDIRFAAIRELDRRYEERQNARPEN